MRHGARREPDGTTGPRGHTERGHRATDSGSWDTHPKPGWGRGTGPDGSQTGPRDHGTKPAHRRGPPGHRFWILGHPPEARLGMRHAARREPDGTTGPSQHTEARPRNQARTGTRPPILGRGVKRGVWNRVGFRSREAARYGAHVVKYIHLQR